ncbi:MAG: FAD-binding oxidoreductase [Anaerolineae bacterium]|nr:FAD-binding oxidoreductase [Anaerolineae bacterium]
MSVVGTEKAYDVIVVGGGFAGTAIAYSLARSGVKSLLLEAGHLCGGTSGACAGRAQIIESETEDYLDLVLQGFRRLEGLSEELGVDLEWDTPGHLSLIRNAEQWQNYCGYVDRLVKRGVEAQMLEANALQRVEPNLRLENVIGAAYSQEGHLNPFKYCMGFARAARRYGAQILPHVPVQEVEMRGERFVTVNTPCGKFSAGVLLIAAGAWSGKLVKMAGLELPVRYTHAEAMVSEPLPPLVYHHVGMPGFYEAVHGASRTVTLGFGQHRSGTLLISNAIQPADDIDMKSTHWGMPAISHSLAEILPSFTDIRMVRTWAAPSPFMPDYLPAIGFLPGAVNVYVAIGFHLAIPTIPVLADWIANDLTAEIKTEALLPFSPNRFFV